MPRRWRILLLLPAVVVLCAGPQLSLAQARFSRVGDLPSAVRVDAADSAAMTHLQRVRAYVADAQWDEAVETLRRVMAEYGEKLIEVTDHQIDDQPARRFVNVQEYCQLRLAALPAEALELYRQRVDPLARSWYEQGVKQRDRGLLMDVVDQLFCSSWGDDALLALGEMALQRGDYAAARDFWVRILPLRAEGYFDTVPSELFERVRKSSGLPPQVATLLDQWYRLDEQADAPVYRLREGDKLDDTSARRLSRLWRSMGLINVLTYPGASLDPAAVDARLVLASIMEGSLDRAQAEWKHFTRDYPQASGRLGGRNVNYSQQLSVLINEAKDWPRPGPSAAWHTFAVTPDRNGRAPGDVDIRGPAWQKKLETVRLPDVRVPVNHGFRPRRVAEGNREPLCHHPVVAHGMALYCNENQVFAFKLADGKPAWEGGEGRPEGEIFYPTKDDVTVPPRQGFLGAPRFTLTVSGDKLFARMGSPITSRASQFVRQRRGYLVCLDLATQGRLVWKKYPPDDNWAFEGSPVADGGFVYVALRRRGANARAHVACYDAENGRLKWRRFVCGADSIGRNQVQEASHHLLTLHQDTLYYNTHLGAVAAISARDGALRWVSIYPRAQRGIGFDINKAPAHYYRDLTPCVYHNGLLFVAPADCESILCLDSRTGQRLWQAAAGKPAVHLLGVAGQKLIASGDRLWWIDVYSGKLLKEFPENANLVQAYGRGALVGGKVYWPTAEQIYVFDEQTGQPTRQPIQLKPRAATGGNLVVGEGHLLIAGKDFLYSFPLSTGK